MMSESTSSTNLLLPSLPTIYSTSEDTRVGVVSTLAGQYQRMLQARPLSTSRFPRPLASASQAAVAGTASKFSLKPADYSLEYCTFGDLYVKYDNDRFIQFQNDISGPKICCSCGFSITPEATEGCSWTRERDGVDIDMLEVWKYHFQPQSASYTRLYCPICNVGESRCGYFTYDGIRDHLELHSIQELDSKGFRARPSPYTSNYTSITRTQQI